MQQVLLRVFPHPPKPNVPGMEKLVEVEEGAVFNDNDPFFISELGGECRIEKRPEEIPANADYALHFLVSPSRVLSLNGIKGWSKISRDCPYCPQR